MMASMAVGGAVGQNIAGAMNNMMGGINQQTTPSVVPPPIPTVAYHIAINGQSTGPFDISVLTQMASAGQFTADSLVWKNGMAQWEKAGAVDELKNCLLMLCLQFHPQLKNNFIIIIYVLRMMVTFLKRWSKNHIKTRVKICIKICILIQQKKTLCGVFFCGHILWGLFLITFHL